MAVPPQPTGGATAFRGVTPEPLPSLLTGGLRSKPPAIPAPSQPSLSASELISKPPAAPALPVGEFAARPPALIVPEAHAPIAPGVRTPITTPAAAPMPAALPPVPTLPGREVGFRGVGRVPTESMLPPTPVLPSEISKPIGQFDAMIRALQLRQGEPSKFVQMPAAGAAPFGPAPAQERMLKRLRDRELARILGGVPV